MKEKRKTAQRFMDVVKEYMQNGDVTERKG